MKKLNSFWYDLNELIKLKPVETTRTEIIQFKMVVYFKPSTKEIDANIESILTDRHLIHTHYKTLHNFIK